MKTPRRIAILANAAPKKGERLFATSPISVILAADAKADAPLPSEIVWMPRGDHDISASMMGGGSWTGLVRCDEFGASVVINAFAASKLAGHRTWLDEDHKDAAATADVRDMRWDPARGIVARIDWTPFGEKLLREKQYCSFSPAFWVDWESGRVAGIIERHALGGLVNAPAFGAAMPALIAARLGSAESTTNPAPDGSSGNQNTNTSMNREKMLKVLAALAVTVPADASDTQVAALYAQHAGVQPPASAAAAPATAAAPAAPAPVAVTAGDSTVVTDLTKKVEGILAANKAAQKKRGEAAIQAAVDRGAIKADDAATRADILGIYEQDENLGNRILASMAGKPTAQSVVVQPDVAQRNAAVAATVTREDLVTALKAYHAEKDSKARIGIYASALSPVIRDRNLILGPILAANSLGSLAGDLIVQRALTLLKFSFPELGVISTDFSGESAEFNQQIISRLKSVPTVSNFVAGTGYTTSDATTTNVPVTISNHKGVEISFNANELSSTQRDLFGEQSDGCHYALGKAFVDALYAVITVANFPTETVSAVGDFGRPKMQLLRKALNGRGVPMPGRFTLLSPDFADKLGNDASLVSLATFQRPEIITEGMLPRVSGFQPYEVQNLPTDENLVGFAGTAESLVIATRVPNNYAEGADGGGGVVASITNPDTGITVQIVRFVDHKKAAQFFRIAVMFGVAKGNPNAGQRLVHTATS